MSTDASTSHLPDRHCDGTADVCLNADPSSVRVARRHARDVCHTLGQDLVDTVELLVSELVTNAVVHARTHCDLWIRPVGHGVRVEVRDYRDRADGHPLLDGGSTEETDGRGLVLVDTLASDWGCDEGPEGGKVVWFEAGDGVAQAARTRGARASRAAG